MRKITGNVVVGQSGGPTAVINSSVAGVYQAAKDMGVAHVYGMVHGVQGFLKKEMIDLDSYLQNGVNVELLKRTPSAFLGSCRYKMPDPEANPEVYEQVFSVMEEFDIEVFFYIGGNDSMDTIKMLSDYAASHGRKERFIGIPKTVDNDLPVTDHSPGYGSAAKYIATSLKEVIRDVQSTGLVTPTVLLVEIMGRHAGWLTAAAALAKGADCDGVDAIYLPETVFDIDAFVAHVEELAKTQNTIVIALSEGIRLEDGRFVCELGGGADSVDVFGHKQLSGCGLVLAGIVSARTGFKTRAIELSTLQRAASHLASRTDVEEAFEAGRYGVRAAAEGATGVMVVMKRTSEKPYFCEMDTFDIHNIANGEKTVPLEWITEDGRGVTDVAVDYIRPLIMGEVYPVFVDGLPAHLVRN